jgi:hypothetical protein
MKASIVLAGIALYAATAGAQEKVTFAGRVVADTTHRPLADVDIVIPDLALGTTSGKDGSFRLAKVPSGAHGVRFRKIGYAMLDTTLRFDGKDSVTIALVRITELDSMKVLGDMRDPGMDDFERNRRMGLGHFYTRADIAKFDNLKTADFLVQTNGIVVNRGTGGEAWVQGKGRSASIRGKGVTVNQQDAIAGAPAAGCFATVYLDNMQVYNPGRTNGPVRKELGITFNEGAMPLFDVNSIPPSSIEAVEFYAGAAQIPSKYMGLNTNCGVLVIHTRRPDKKP